MNYKQLYRWITIASGTSIILSVLAFVIVSMIAKEWIQFDFQAGGSAAVVIPSIVSIIIGSTALYSYVKREDENFNESIVIWQEISTQLRELHVLVRNITTDEFMSDCTLALNYLRSSQNFFLNEFNNQEIFKIVIINRSLNQKKGSLILSNHYNRIARFKADYLELINILERQSDNLNFELKKSIQKLLEMIIVFIAELEDLDSRKRIEELLIIGEKDYLDILHQDIADSALRWNQSPVDFEPIIDSIQTHKAPIRKFIYQYLGLILNASDITYETVENLTNKKYCKEMFGIDFPVLYHGNNSRRNNVYSNGRSIFKGRYYYVYLFEEVNRSHIERWIIELKKTLEKKKVDS